MPASNDSNTLHPTVERMIEIADAADALARSLRDHWFVFDMTPKENPHRVFCGNGDLADPEYQKHLIREICEVLKPRNNLRDLLDDVSPGDAG